MADKIYCTIKEEIINVKMLDSNQDIFVTIQGGGVIENFAQLISTYKLMLKTVYDIDGQQNIFVRAFGPLKLTGISTSGQTGTLRLNIGSGRAFSLGQFYPHNPETPSTYDVATYNTASIIRIYRSGSEYKFDNKANSS